MLTLEKKLKILEIEQTLRATVAHEEQYYSDYVMSLDNDELKREIAKCREEITKKNTGQNSSSQ